tara:strand:- start:665 stop:991 length:327 start_codon:yes stop_codon:yes gene_type:complete
MSSNAVQNKQKDNPVKDVERTVDNMVSNFSLHEFLKRLVKYLLEGLAVALVAYYIPQKKMKLEEIAMISLTAAATFAILDLWAPTLGTWSRQGAGFGVGAGLVGFPAV